MDGWEHDDAGKLQGKNREGKKKKQSMITPRGVSVDETNIYSQPKSREWAVDTAEPNPTGEPVGKKDAFNGMDASEACGSCP